MTTEATTPTQTETENAPKTPASKAKVQKAKTPAALKKDLAVAKTRKKPAVKKANPTPTTDSPGTRKTKVLKSLLKFGATGATSGRTLDEIAGKVGYDRKEVYGAISGLTGEAGSNPRCLMATGHVKTVKHDGTPLQVYLTAKGKAADFNSPPFTDDRLPAKK